MTLTNKCLRLEDLEERHDISYKDIEDIGDELKLVKEMFKI